MRELIEKFFDSYLRKRKKEEVLAFMTDQVISIGTGEHEVARGKKEFEDLLEREFAELPDPLEYEIYNYSEVPETDSVRNVFLNILVKLHQGETETEMRPRLTCTCIKRDGEWKISCVHLSMPSGEQREGTFFPLYYGTQTKGKLSDDSNVKLMDLIADALPGGIMGGYMEEDYPLYTINDKMLQILGYTYEELIEQTDEKMMNIIYEEDRESVRKSIEEQFEEKGQYEIEYRAIGRGGQLIWVNDVGKKIVTEDGRDAMISIVTDITERVEREKRLIEEASLDPLTSLYNRKKAQQLIEESFETAGGGVLFVCDIDHFKSINDTRGHVEGDRVLIELASIIKEKVGKEIVTARIGGDEYMLFFPESIKEEAAMQQIARIQHEFSERMKKRLPDLLVELSAGAAARRLCEDFEELYQRADAALYQEKNKKADRKDR